MKILRYLATGFLFIACVTGCSPGAPTDKSGSTRPGGLPDEGTPVFDGTRLLTTDRGRNINGEFITELMNYEENLVALYLASLKGRLNDNLKINARAARAVLQARLTLLDDHNDVTNDRIDAAKEKRDITARLLRVLMLELGGDAKKINALDVHAFLSILYDDSY